MPYRLLTPLPAARSLDLIAAGANPFVFSRLSSLPPDSKADALGLLAGHAPPADELESSLVALAREGIIQRLAGKRGEEVALTEKGGLCVELYRSIIAWARSVTTDPAENGSPISWRLIKVLALAWRSGAVIALSGQVRTPEEVAVATRNDEKEMADVIGQMAHFGLVAKVPRGGFGLGLTRDMKCAAAAIAAAVRLERILDPAMINHIKPGHVEVGLRLCLESIGLGHFQPALEGTFAAICVLPDGRETGVLADFFDGSTCSVSPLRGGTMEQGGLRGDIDQYLRLVALGERDAVGTFGVRRAGDRLATAICACLPRP